MFAVEVLSGIRWPAIIGFEQDTINGIFVVPKCGIDVPLVAS